MEPAKRLYRQGDEPVKLYRRVTLDVTAEGDLDDELLPAILITLGVVETPFIGGTGIQVMDMDEQRLMLEPDYGVFPPDAARGTVGSGDGEGKD